MLLNVIESIESIAIEYYYWMPFIGIQYYSFHTDAYNVFV